VERGSTGSDSPTQEVVEIGETGWFKRRMEQFSAGFRMAWEDGHSTAWKWPEGRHENLWVAVFPLGGDLDTTWRKDCANGWRPLRSMSTGTARFRC
jgi:hypothetical protein